MSASSSTPAAAAARTTSAGVIRRRSAASGIAGRKWDAWLLRVMGSRGRGAYWTAGPVGGDAVSADDCASGRGRKIAGAVATAMALAVDPLRRP